MWRARFQDARVLNLRRRPLRPGAMTVSVSSPTAFQQAIADLTAALGNKISTNPSVCLTHGTDESSHAPKAADAVLFAETAADIQAAIAICRTHQLPLIPFGVGSSLEGHIIPGARGALSVDTTQMNKVLEINAADLDCRVQAGVTREGLNHELRDQGLFFPIDPGAHASLGGMAATRASGTNAVRYGTMKDVVLGLTAVMPNGEILTSGTRALKSSAGYDLTRLLVGSEGTLGLITELQLKLFGIPEAVSAAVCPFASVAAAAETAILVKQMGIPVARMELLDGLAMQAVNAYSHLDLAEQPTMFFEFHGSEAGVAEQAGAVGEIVEDQGGGPFAWSSLPEERSKLWDARHTAYYAMLGLRPGGRALTTDVCVPISALADTITETVADATENKLLAPIVGHVGDGNFHCLLLLDPGDEREAAAAAGFAERLARRAQGYGGTCTGEHGVGIGKGKYLQAEVGATGLALMGQIKRAFDPDNLFNPGKLGCL